MLYMLTIYLMSDCIGISALSSHDRKLDFTHFQIEIILVY